MHGARRSVVLLACAGVLASVGIGLGSPAVLVAGASHAQRAQPPRPTPAPARPAAVPTAPPVTATPHSHPNHDPLAQPTIDPGIPLLSVPTAIAVPVGPPPAHPTPPGRINAGLPAVPTLPGLTVPPMPSPAPAVSVPDPPASPAHLPAAVPVSGGVEGPGPLALAGIALAAGFIGVTSLAERRRQTLSGAGTTDAGDEPPGS